MVSYRSVPGVVFVEIEPRFCAVGVRDDADLDPAAVDVQLRGEVRHEVLDVVEVWLV